jgi:hypothetical protein
VKRKSSEEINMNAEDYKALIKSLYFPKRPEIIEIPPLRYAMIDGQGDPNTSEAFQDAVGALYAVSYGIKMLPKKGIVPEGYFEYKVNALEGLWDMRESTDFDGANKDAFVWTLMIQQPPFVTQALFDDIREAQLKKKGNEALTRVRLETLNEGLCCQALHIGSFDDEPATFDAMHAFIEAQGYRRPSKKHHEIYMSDFRRVAPEKCKTVLRFGVTAK